MKKKRIKTPTLRQSYCIDCLAATFGGDHHLPPVYEWGDGVEMSYPGDLATFDFDRLTRLVINAHKFAVRISIAGSTPRSVRIIAHARRPFVEGDSIGQYHPSLKDLRDAITDDL